jgi:hypothetical protein
MLTHSHSPSRQATLRGDECMGLQIEILYSTVLYERAITNIKNISKRNVDRRSLPQLSTGVALLAWLDCSECSSVSVLLSPPPRPLRATGKRADCTQEQNTPHFSFRTPFLVSAILIRPNPSSTRLFISSVDCENFTQWTAQR